MSEKLFFYSSNSICVYMNCIKQNRKESLSIYISSNEHCYLLKKNNFKEYMNRNIWSFIPTILIFKNQLRYNLWTGLSKFKLYNKLNFIVSNSVSKITMLCEIESQNWGRLHGFSAWFLQSAAVLGHQAQPLIAQFKRSQPSLWLYINWLFDLYSANTTP